MVLMTWLTLVVVKIDVCDSFGVIKKIPRAPVAPSAPIAEEGTCSALACASLRSSSWKKETYAQRRSLPGDHGLNCAASPEGDLRGDRQKASASSFVAHAEKKHRQISEDDQRGRFFHLWPNVEGQPCQDWRAACSLRLRHS